MHRINSHSSWKEEKITHSVKTHLLAEMNKGPSYRLNETDIQQIAGRGSDVSKGFNRHDSWIEEDSFDDENISKRGDFNLCRMHGRENCRE